MKIKYSHRSANYDCGEGHTRAPLRQRPRSRTQTEADKIAGFNGVQQGLSAREPLDPARDEGYVSSYIGGYPL